MHLLFVKVLTIFSFLLTLISLIPISFAQIQFYGVDVNLDKNGRSYVTLTITFYEVEKEFNFQVLGRVENLKASSDFGSVDCKAEVKGISEINCDINISVGRTIVISFETNDFVKVFDSKYYFDGDFTLGKDISKIFATVKLPEGMALIEENLNASRVSFPENASILSSGRKIIVTWRLEEIKSNQNLKLQFLYESIAEVQPISLRYFVVLGVVIALVLAFVYIRFFKKPQKLVLSVLDEFERKVMDVIIASGGVVNQKKVVEQTNLSKAKVSRVIKSLVNRGLIEVERSGRINRLKLLKKRLSF